MKICNLASGSKGNSTYIQTSNYKILIDLGKNKKYIVENLKKINVDYKDIDYIFLTHIHDDHTSALKTFLKGCKGKLVITKKMYKELDYLKDFSNIIIYDEDPIIENLDIKSFKMSHDVSDIRAFLINDCESSLVYITDTGYINSRYFKFLKGKNAYFIECNHDIEMLTHGPYPEYLKRRVLSDEGHLSNKFTGIYLSKMINDNTKNITLLHLSEINNTEKIALETVRNALKENDYKNELYCAKQDMLSKVVEI